MLRKELEETKGALARCEEVHGCTNHKSPSLLTTRRGSRPSMWRSREYLYAGFVVALPSNPSGTILSRLRI